MPTYAVQLEGLSASIRLDTSDKTPSYLVTTEQGNYVKLSASAYHLLSWIAEGRSIEDIAARMSSAGRPVTAADVTAAHDRLVARLAEFGPPRKVSAGFLRRATLIPAAVVRPLAQALTPLFHAPVVAALLTLTLVVVLPLIDFGTSVNSMNEHFGAALSLTLFSLLIHEFGHAAACARYGARPDEIGIGIYFVYPAFYCNVSDAWRLTRRQRVVVDAGGMYFQVLTAGAFVGLYALTGWEPFRVSLLLIWGSLVFSLNPFFKFDGYWLLSDTLGVANLRDQWRRLLRFVRARLSGNTTARLPWPTHVAICVALCSIGSLLLWMKFIIYLGPMLWSVARSYLTFVLATGSWVLVHSEAPDGGQVWALAIRTYVFVCFMAITWRLLRTIQRSFARLLKTKRPTETLGTSFGAMSRGRDGEPLGSSTLSDHRPAAQAAREAFIANPVV